MTIDVSTNTVSSNGALLPFTDEMFTPMRDSFATLLRPLSADPRPAIRVCPG